MAGVTVGGVGVTKVPPKITPPLHRTLGGNLAPGTAVTNAVNVTELVNISNCVGFIVRIMPGATTTGNLVVAYVRPNAQMPQPVTSGGSYGYTTYGTNQPATVAVLANTEAVLMVKADGSAGSYNGEHYMIVQFQPTATGSIVWVDLALMARSY